MKSIKIIITILFFAFGSYTVLTGSDQIPITIENHKAGAPITIGIPFAQGTLMSPDHVRLLDKTGKEIQCQTTQVSTWEPLDFSVKWLWVFFFATDDNEYVLEYGADVIKAPITGDKIKIKNAQRTLQNSYVETGPLRFTISKKSGGFIDDVLLDLDRDGFDENDTIAIAKGGRGSFLDLLDDLGIDSSTAVVHRTIREKGSGPLHSILRLEGEYTYQREDNRSSPFIIRIHLYAGQSYIRVYHTLTYTGVPDKHKPTSGQHANIAMGNSDELINDAESSDIGWTQPNDRIASTGLSLEYNLKPNASYTCGYNEGKWHSPGAGKIYSDRLKSGSASIFQNGPKPSRTPPVPTSDLEERIDGFSAEINTNGKKRKDIERAEGWADLSDDKWGISIGIKNFIQEYPKEITFDMNGRHAIAYLWSPSADPMSFERSNLDRDEGMIANFAEGVTKTSEVVINFHKGGLKDVELKKTMEYFIAPPVPHADPETYSRSLVYGHFAPRSEDHLEFERSIDYKFDWNFFNQDWEPWYGMFDYGDQMNIFFRDNWYRWENNEPAIDFMHWLQFMRTGDPKYYHRGEAMSRHTMDVDNVHWPTDPKYYGDTNDAIDFWKMSAETEAQKGTPYLGIGRRHATQHWTALLSAHVWLEGWIAAYNLTGYHRGLDVARLTADSYTRRLWGEHGLTGRRLYLSVWNLVEAFDATKDQRYMDDLKDRVDRMLYLQNGPDQYDNLVIDRYGYSQIYASHGLYKYYQLTKDERVRQALIRHARAVRDNPPYNHEYESFLATIHSLLLGYEFTKEESFLDEAKRRSEVLKMDELKQSFEQLGTQKAIGDALNAVSRLPDKGDLTPQSRWVENWNVLQGLRVFGWTHIYNIPWLIHWLDEHENSNK